MVGQQQEHLVQLHRDTISTSWGFRLQGGQENSTPLTVQRVFVGGVSDGKLQRGDVVVAIGGHNARGMYHSQAEDIIKGAERDVSFKVLRGGGGGGEGGGGGVGGGGHVASFAQNDYNSYQLPWQTSAPAAAAAAAAAAPSWPGTSDDVDHEHRSFGDLRQQFSQPSTAGRIQTRPDPGTTSYVPKRPVIIKKHGQYEGLSDPGWTPGSSRSQQGAPKSSRYVPRSPPVNVHAHPQYPSRPPQEIRHEAPEPPAWLGTLRSGGGPKRWEIQEGQNLMGGGAHVPAPVKQEQAIRPAYYSTDPIGGEGVQVHNPRIQGARYGPGAAGPTYEQHSAEGAESDTARVAHLQYNTPLGLYSKASAREALEGQTHGKAGYGTMQITGTGPSGPAGKIKPFDPAHSDVYRLVLEEDEVKKAGGGPGGPRRQGPNRAATAPAAQSRPANSPRHQPDDQHSAKFDQLVHENDDQAHQYAGIHPEQYQHQQPAAHGRFDDTGVSDF